MKRTILTFVLVVAAMMAMGQTKVVWEKPTTEFRSHNGNRTGRLFLDVTRVELMDMETLVYITVMQTPIPDYWFRFASDTYLKVGNNRYTVLSADGIELNKQERTNKDGKRDVVFHFPPLPRGTKSFDFIEGDGEGAFQIKGIKPVEERWKQFFPSYWRNERTGDWDIAFLEDFVIYDGQFWNYMEKPDVNKQVGDGKIFCLIIFGLIQQKFVQFAFGTLERSKVSFGCQHSNGNVRKAHRNNGQSGELRLNISYASRALSFSSEDAGDG